MQCFLHFHFAKYLRSSFPTIDHSRTPEPADVNNPFLTVKLNVLKTARLLCAIVQFD